MQNKNKRTGEFLLLASSLYYYSEYEQTVYHNMIKGTRSSFDTCILLNENSKDAELQALLRKYIEPLGT